MQQVYNYCSTEHNAQEILSLAQHPWVPYSMVSAAGMVNFVLLMATKTLHVVHLGKYSP